MKDFTKVQMYLDKAAENLLAAVDELKEMGVVDLFSRTSGKYEALLEINGLMLSVQRNKRRMEFHERIARLTAAQDRVGGR